MAGLDAAQRLVSSLKREVLETEEALQRAVETERTHQAAAASLEAHVATLVLQLSAEKRAKEEEVGGLVELKSELELRVEFLDAQLRSLEDERDSLAVSERTLADKVVQRDHAHESDLVDLKKKVHKLFQLKSEEHRTSLKAAADQFEADKVAAQNEVHRLFKRQEEEHLAEKEVGSLRTCVLPLRQPRLRESWRIKSLRRTRNLSATTTDAPGYHRHCQELERASQRT